MFSCLNGGGDLGPTLDRTIVPGPAYMRNYILEPPELFKCYPGTAVSPGQGTWRQAQLSGVMAHHIFLSFKQLVGDRSPPGQDTSRQV